MTYIYKDNKKIDFDLEGYLKNSKEWNEHLAHIIAKQENIIMTNLHWEVIYFIRDFYQNFNISPTMRMLVTAMEKKFGKDIGNSRYLFKLFPDGPAKQAVKIAGLPKAAKCL